MPRVISTHSFRGGTGKSNTTANIAYLVAKRGHRVGVIDTDIQSPGIHVLFHLDEDQINKSLNDYLHGLCKIEDASYDVTPPEIREGPAGSRAAVYLIPSSLNSGDIARILREGYDVTRLNDGIREIIRRLSLDYLFIDTHPGVNEETLLSIAISDVLLVVMRPDQQDYLGSAVTIDLARRLEVPDMRIIVNKTPLSIDRDSVKHKIEATFEVPVLAVFPLSEEMATVASEDLFVRRRRRSRADAPAQRGSELSLRTRFMGRWSHVLKSRFEASGGCPRR